MSKQKTITGVVNGQNLSLDQAVLNVAGTVNFYKLKLALDDDWDGLDAILVSFSALHLEKPFVEIYDKNNGVMIPWEVYQTKDGRVTVIKIGLMGYQGEDLKITTTSENDGNALVVSPANMDYNADENPSVTPTPDIVQTIFAKIGNLDDLDTEDKSNLVKAINEIYGKGDSDKAELLEEIAKAVAAEASARQDADSALKVDLDEESAAREQADAALQEAVDGKQEQLNEAQLNAVNSGINSGKVQQIATNTTDIATNTANIANNTANISSNTSDILNINQKIPSQATADNQLADKDFVSSSLAPLTQKLQGIEAGAEVNKINTIKRNGTALTPDSAKAVDIIVPTKTSDLTNDSDFQTGNDVKEALAGYLPLASSAGFHNSICRGANLLEVFRESADDSTATIIARMSAALEAGDLSKYFVGDYIPMTLTVGNNAPEEDNYIVASINHFKGLGDTELNKNHLVLVPENGFKELIKMNDTNTTTGGYYGSKAHGTLEPTYTAGTGGTLTNVASDYATFKNKVTDSDTDATYTFVRVGSQWQLDGANVGANLSAYGITYTGTPVEGDQIEVALVNGYLEPIRQAIYKAFGNEHILTFRMPMTISTSSSPWHSARVELMNECLLYGQKIWANNNEGEKFANIQLPYFAHQPNAKVAHCGKGGARNTSWLSSIHSGSNFCNVNNYGNASGNSASNSYAARPFFLFS